MGATIIVNGRTVVHKDSGGKAPSVPDFCKTPTPPGPPVPIPYVNVAQSSDTADGSKKVKMDGNPIMLKTSKFSTSKGDEAGTAKGVASSTSSGIAKFVNYSFDVKVEGKNVPRLGDPMTNNGNGANTTTVKELQVATGVSDIDMTDEQVKLICEAFCDTQEEYDRGQISGRGCCSTRLEQKLKALNAPDIMSEVPCHFGACAGGAVITPNHIRNSLLYARRASSPLVRRLSQLTKWAQRGLSPNAPVTNGMARAFVDTLKKAGTKVWVQWPDIVTKNPLTGGMEHLDAKFRSKTSQDQLSRAQKANYPKLNNKETIVIDNVACGCSASI